MAAKLLPNRISKTPATDARDKIREAIRVILDALGTDTHITDEAYRSLRKIADKSKRTTDDVFDILKDNTTFLEEPLTLDETQKDKGFYEFCDDVRAILAPIQFKLEREQNIAGSEYANACSIFEDTVKRKVNLGNAKARSVQAQLDRIDRNRGGGPSKSSGKSTGESK